MRAPPRVPAAVVLESRVDLEPGGADSAAHIGAYDAHERALQLRTKHPSYVPAVERVARCYPQYARPRTDLPDRLPITPLRPPSQLDEASRPKRVSVKNEGLLSHNGAQ